jgi:hypothetical protein
MFKNLPNYIWVSVVFGPYGVYLINVLRAAFFHIDPKSEKKTGILSVFFVLLGSAHAKAVHRTMMKLKPGEI